MRRILKQLLYLITVKKNCLAQFWVISIIRNMFFFSVGDEGKNTQRSMLAASTRVVESESVFQNCRSRNSKKTSDSTTLVSTPKLSQNKVREVVKPWLVLL